MEEITQTTIRVLSNSSYRFNFIKFKDKFKNQDEFLNALLDLYEKMKKIGVKRVAVPDDKKVENQKKQTFKSIN